tara:strand:+ start:1986 stop:3917 length:1932 start_codon:yes stop_codon:yes gene_type:complete
MLRLLAIVIPVATLAIWLLISTLSKFYAEQAIARDAGHKALHWGEYMSERVPELEQLIATGIPSPEQKQIIRQIRTLGDVFRFKLFDANGRLVLVSDENSISNPVGVSAEHDPETMTAVRTRKSVIAVRDGAETNGWPDLYAEAYVPLLDDLGRIAGIIEVYVDVTSTETYFEESFDKFGVIVSFASALLFLLPAVGFAMQRRTAHRSLEEVEYLSRYDPLTGLANRAEFTRRAGALHADGKLSSLLFIDADKFKTINDTHGHAVGDAFLAQLGRILTSQTEACDIVARFGGDEFVVAFCGLRTEMLEPRVRAILKQCAQPLLADGVSITGSVSIGVAIASEGNSLQDTIAQADAALYFSKSEGRNQFAIYGDSMGEQLRRRVELETLVRNAAENETFTLDYQPLVAGDDFHPIGYEALLRLKREDGTFVPPVEFIPLAEDMGLIDKIGRWVIYTATRAISLQAGELKIAVNLSAVQFRRGDLPEIVADALARSGLPANRLELEITESLLLGDDPFVLFQIDTLRDMGVGIAMDDFGTGYSSLGYLWRYGFDRIKIDRSFVAGLLDNPERSLEILDSVVMLGKKLGMKVTAEGVETEEQSKLLTKLGCDVLQGYMFGRPAPLPDVPGSRETPETVSPPLSREA